MARKPKPKGTRKPPDTAGDHGIVREWMAGVMPAVQPIVERVDRLIRKEIAGLEYAIKWQKAYYGLPGQGWIIEVAAYHVSVNVVFFAGAKFDPPPPLGEGSRYIKLTDAEDVDTPAMRKWLGQAREMPGWGAD